MHRLVRWMTLRFRMIPQSAIFEIFTNSQIIGLMAGLSAKFIFEIPFFMFFFFHMLLWFVFDMILLCLVQDSPITNGFVDIFPAWIFGIWFLIIYFIYLKLAFSFILFFHPDRS